MDTDCIGSNKSNYIPRLFHDQAVINEYEFNAATAKLSSYDNVFLAVLARDAQRF